MRQLQLSNPDLESQGSASSAVCTIPVCVAPSCKRTAVTVVVLLAHAACHMCCVSVALNRVSVSVFEEEDSTSRDQPTRLIKCAKCGNVVHEYRGPKTCV